MRLFLPSVVAAAAASRLFVPGASPQQPAPPPAAAQPRVAAPLPQLRLAATSRPTSALRDSEFGIAVLAVFAVGVAAVALQARRQSGASSGDPARSGRTAPVVMMAGFGASPKAKPAKKEPLSPKKQWTAFIRLKDDGAAPVDVYARDDATDGDVWQLIGQVAVGAGASAAEAVQYQKRLILEHAGRLSPRLKAATKTLAMGIAEGDGVVPHEKPATMPAKPKCGFVGEPDYSGFYAKPSGTSGNESSGTKRTVYT